MDLHGFPGFIGFSKVLWCFLGFSKVFCGFLALFRILWCFLRFSKVFWSFVLMAFTTDPCSGACRHGLYTWQVKRTSTPLIKQKRNTTKGILARVF